MSGFFGAVLKSDCVFDVFFGTDYHSHLGTRRAGMVFYGEDGFDRSIHNIENTPFRTKFDSDIHQMRGNLGLGCISDYEAQPLIVRSHHGTYALATVSKINNMDELTEEIIQKGSTHFLEMSGGDINATELVATLINQKDNLIEGIRYAQERIDGALTLLLLTPDGLYCARDKLGRTPVMIGRKEDGYCAVFESCSYLNLEYEDDRELGPGEIAVLTPEGVKTLVAPGKDMRICTFYGFTTAIHLPVMKACLWRKCVITAGWRWRNVTDLQKKMWISLPASLIQGLPMPWGMPTGRACPFRGRL
ncbi:MAG: hypothetical protein ACLVHE_02900 [Dialister invisus]